MSSLLDSSRRQSPSPSPTPPDRRLARLPDSRSAELKFTLAPAFRWSEMGPKRRPAPSMAWICTVPARSE